MQNNDVTQIRIKYIPALFPNYDFSDRKYVDYRVVKLPENQIELIKTDKKFKRVDTNISTNQLIQSIVYSRYELELFINENIEIDYCKYARDVEIITNYGLTYKAEVTSIEYEKQEKSYFYHVNLTFIDLVEDEKSISNYLDKTFIQNVIGLNNANCLVLQPKYNIYNTDGFETGNQFKIYTILEPDFTRVDGNIIEQKFENGQKVFVNTQDNAICQLRFYLSESEKNLFLSYAKRAFYYENQIEKGIELLLVNHENIIPTNPIDYTISSKNELIGLYELIIELSYDFINYYHFQ